MNNLIQEKTKNYYKTAKLFPFLFLFYAFSYWDYLLLLPLFFKKAGISESHIGNIISIFPLTTLILIFPLGMIADRVSARVLMTVGAIGAGLFGLLMPACVGVRSFMAVTALGGSSFTCYFIGFNALFYKHVEESGRGMQTAWFFVGGTVGFGLGASLGGFLIEIMGMKGIFYVGIAGTIAMLITGLMTPPAPMMKIRISDYINDLRQPAAIIVTAIMFAINTHIGAEQVGFALLMENVVGLKGSQMGLIMAMLAAWISIWSLVAGRSFDAARRPILMLGISVMWSGVFQFLTVYSRGFASFTLMRLMHSFGDGFFNVINIILIGISFPKGRAGGNFGFILMVNTAAIFLAHNVSGMLMQGGKYGMPFQISGLIMAGGGFIILLFRKPICRLLHLNTTG